MDQSYFWIDPFGLSDRMRTVLELLRLVIFFALAAYMLCKTVVFVASFISLATTPSATVTAVCSAPFWRRTKETTGIFPIQVDQPYEHLSADLVDMKFLRKPPIDPPGSYRYVSDGSYYALVLKNERVRWGSGASPGRDCLVSVDAHDAQWAAIPPCRLD